MTVPAVREDALSGVITSVGLHLKDPDLPFEDFEHICFVLGKWHEAVRFAIGDALMLGEEMYGEAAYQAFEALNISEEGKREYLRVSLRVPRSRRRRDLSWSHHRAVASLEPVEQKEWLAKASAEQMSHHTLREALRNGEPPKPSVCRCCHRPFE